MVLLPDDTTSYVTFIKVTAGNVLTLNCSNVFLCIRKRQKKLDIPIASEVILLREMYWWRQSKKRVSVKLVLGHVICTTYRQQDEPEPLLLKRELKCKL